MSTQQVSYHGVGVSAGRVIGPVLRMPDPITAPADGAPLPEGSTADAEIERLAAAGVACEPIRTDEYTGQRFTFFADPDGLPLELYEAG